MVEYDLPVTLVKHRGFFDFFVLLQSIRKWFVDDDFDTFNIPLHLQKFPGITGVEHLIKIHGEKKITEYVKFHIDVQIRVVNMREVEIIREGKKFKTQDGSLDIEIVPKLELDWQKRFSGPKPWKGFLEALDVFYRKYIIKYKISDYWEDMILMKSTQLARVIKETIGQEIL